MKPKVEFNGETLLIVIQPHAARPSEIVFLDPVRDIYSAWKNWARSEKNLGYPEAAKAFGAADHPDAPPPFVLLFNGWRLQPSNNCERIEVKSFLGNDDPKKKALSPRPDGAEIPAPTVIGQLDRKGLWRGASNSFMSLIVAALCFWYWAPASSWDPEAIIAGSVASVNAASNFGFHVFLPWYKRR